MVIRKIAFILLLSFQLCFINGFSADTLRIVSHDGITVVTDPSKGFNPYKSWVRFPSAKEPIRKIIMTVGFACPDTMRCADWDYKDHITIRRTGGIAGPSLDYEIGRMLTPYGGAFGKDWKFSWDLDVTDFSSLLRDSVEIEYNHTGWEPNQDRGWKITVSFELIKGLPVLEPIAIQKIYDGSFPYGNEANGIEKHLAPVNFTVPAEAKLARFRVVQTGHGMVRPDGCGEFCNKTRDLLFDNKLVDRRAIWMECGDNPLYPQAGTWIYDRANWCPGTLMQPDIYNFHVKPGETHTIDLNMQQYTASKEGAEEVISGYLVFYRNTAKPNDAEIQEIINPGLKDKYKRINSSLNNPAIIARNNGSNIISTMHIRYGVGNNLQSYLWKGTLKPHESVKLVLPGIVENTGGLFQAEILKVNGRKDAYTGDNRLAGNFDPLPVHDSTLIIYLATNNQPSQNAYYVADQTGKLIYERKPGSLERNKLYRDTLKLSSGYYEFHLLDSADNGLEFWANPQGGRGRARLLDSAGMMLKNFESDFGKSVSYAFRVGGAVTPVKQELSFGLYPTRTDSITSFDYYSNFPEDIVVQLITDPGEDVVEEHRYYKIREGIFTYDLSRYDKGRFYLRVLVGGEEKFKKRIRYKE